MYFKVCCDTTFDRPQSVGILFFSGTPTIASSYDVYLSHEPHRLVKFPHNTEIVLTPTEARAVWTVLVKNEWR
jgi:hypothetical protein